VKIYFDNVNFSSSSGPNTFGSRLAKAFVKNGIEIVDKKDQYDIFLCFIEPTHKPRPGSKFVQRLDGIWFKPEQFESHNQLIKWTYANCDAVVWQSEFDKNMTVKWWGARAGEVISNGIEIEKIIPSNQDFVGWRNQFDKLFVCSASWHRQKRLKENVELFQQVSSAKDALVVLGKAPDHLVKASNIFYLGQRTHSECLEIYALSDWMIHLAWLDHCPNVVVEALSQNCPVICTDSGGTKEIVRDNGIIIQESNPYEYQLCDYDNPPPIDLTKTYLNKIEVQNDYLDIAGVATQYLDLFNKI
jgi:glycosyltransferase involved in cell wall biosynthesis